METMEMTEPGLVENARRGEESKEMVDLEKVAGMSLESLLYYVLVGEGRRRRAGDPNM
jgi:hypothetical protein